MNIRHYITIDSGSGPTSLVQIDDEMIRVSHRARFDRTKKVDPVQARAMVESMQNLGNASTSVPEEHAAELAEEVLTWISRQQGDTSTPASIRWLEDGAALTFRTEAEAGTYDETRGAVEALKPRKRKRMMMG